MTQEMIDFITPYLVSLLGAYAVPVITALGLVFIAVKVIGMVKEACESVKHNDGYDKLSKQLSAISQENVELKKKYNELLTEISKVKHD